MPAARRRSGTGAEPERGRAPAGERRRRPSERRSGSGSDRELGERDVSVADTRLTARDAARKAAGYVREMTGREAEGVTSLSRTDEGWQIGIEVVESRRVPDSTDILAVYRVDLDGDGELISYSRDTRYYRGRAEE